MEYGTVDSRGKKHQWLLLQNRQYCMIIISFVGREGGREGGIDLPDL